MYKYVSVALLVLLLLAGGLYGFERYSHSKTKRETNNQIAKLEGTVQETETVLSRRALVIEGLWSQNDELQDIIDERDEEILALGKISIKWRDKYFKVKNVKQTIITEDPPEDDPYWDDPTEDPTRARDICNQTLRVKVEFEHEDEYVTVYGHTLTNPPEAEIGLVWEKELNLNIILAKDDAGGFRIYTDPESDLMVPTELSLVVDPSVLERAWYENIAFNAFVAGGDGGFQIGIGAHYNIMSNFYLGPMVILGINDSLQPRVYGAVVLGWYPWRL